MAATSFVVGRSVEESQHAAHGSRRYPCISCYWRKASSARARAGLRHDRAAIPKRFHLWEAFIPTQPFQRRKRRGYSISYLSPQPTHESKLVLGYRYSPLAGRRIGEAEVPGPGAHGDVAIRQRAMAALTTLGFADTSEGTSTVGLNEQRHESNADELAYRSCSEGEADRAEQREPPTLQPPSCPAAVAACRCACGRASRLFGTLAS